MNWDFFICNQFIFKINQFLAVNKMEQAYNHFNSGKYKDAYKYFFAYQISLLASSNLNIDSYQPNLAICEYLSNRCVQSSLSCHKKLNEWLLKKFKRQNYKLDHQTESIVKLNIAILLILLGKKDNAFLVMTDIYKNRACFIEFMQSRIFLLLMELNINLRNSTNVLTLYKKYPLEPIQSRNNQPTQWISLILHEHNKSSTICKQQFTFLTRIFLNQALMQLSISDQFLSTKQQDKQLKQQLIQRIKKRKNNINKYYQFNIRMISHFHEAEKQLHSNNYIKCLSLMNFANIQTQYEQMPSTKIIANILNALTTSNVGMVHFAQKKYHIALGYFSKAKTLLAKGCTGVQDKDLQLFSINYSNNNQAISYNMALSLLVVKSKQAYSAFESIRKSNPNNQNFKWWYRVGQSILQNYHQCDYSKIDQDKIIQMLQQAEQCFTCSLTLVDKNKFPDEHTIRSIVPDITEEEIQIAHMRFKAEKRDFKKSIVSILCYIYNSLGKYANTIQLGSQILKQDLKINDKINIQHYMIEALSSLNRENQKKRLQNMLVELNNNTNLIKQSTVEMFYTDEPYTKLNLTYEDLYVYQMALYRIKNQEQYEAAKLVQNLRAKAGLYPNPVLKLLLRYLHIQIGLEKKYMTQYLK